MTKVKNIQETTLTPEQQIQSSKDVLTTNFQKFMSDFSMCLTSYHQYVKNLHDFNEKFNSLIPNEKTEN